MLRSIEISMIELKWCQMKREIKHLSNSLLMIDKFSLIPINAMCADDCDQNKTNSLEMGKNGDVLCDLQTFRE